MKRRDFIKTAGGLILLAGATPWPEVLASDKTTGGHPLNLLFITADDMNATMPGWMGNPLKPTPNMDAFAATCHRFVNNRDAAPICQPSREAMMTGLWPHRSGGLGFTPINDGIPTLVTVLQKHGYFAGALNKIPHMAPPTSFPWDISKYDSGKNPPMIGDEVAELIKAAQQAGKPFFINCNITDPHRPFYGTGEKSAKNNPLDDIVPRLITAEQVPVPSFLEDLPDVRKELAQYYNSVQRLDLSFGRAMAALQASGELEHTVVIFVSDHGMPFPFSKATVYNNGPWCPVLLRCPSLDKARAYEEMTGSIDIMPTLLDLLGVPKPDGMDGRTWMPLLKGEIEADRDYIISNVNSVSSGKNFPQRVVQTKTSALIFAPWSGGTNRFRVESMDGLTYNAMVTAAQTDPRIQARIDQYVIGYPMAFYDLVKDPDQRVNAIKDPAHSQEVKRLQQILLTYMEKTGDPQLANFKTYLAGGTVVVDPGPGNAGKKKGKKPGGAEI